MYVTNRCQSQASDTPLPAGWADEQRRLYVEPIARAVHAANENYRTLVNRPDLDDRGMPSSRPAGESYPSGAPAMRRIEIPTAAVCSPSAVLGPSPNETECGGYFRRATGPAQPLVVEKPAVVEPPPAPAAKQRSGDICRDLRDSVILQSDVSIEQLWECSQQAPLTGVIGVYSQPGIALAGLSGCPRSQPARSEPDDDGAPGQCLLGIGLLVGLAFVLGRGAR